MTRHNLFTKIPIRTYIRPHYYDNSLSKAMKQQQNPFRRIGRFLDEMDHKKVLWTMIGTNVVVFCCWQYAKDSYKQFGDSRWLDFMCRHFTLNKTSMDASQYHTLLTSTFSHSSLPHLAMNMFVLQSMGEGVLTAIGTSRFLLLYTGAGIVASLSSLVYSKYIRPLLETNKFGYRQNMNTLSLGASGSLMGLASFFAAAFPKTTFYVFFIIPMPALACVGLFAAVDVYLASTLNVSDSRFLKEHDPNSLFIERYS
ncbi:uncharacterized protein RHIMIDRAFT_277483 [Rhizopus microsporus ATCC 52813]|uniref:Peptidase S54 rhomboid domain-containing protein n=1 Tax=Rhizopus microsporus ATCC 52813 TaxID=1340429 RepID=A0A2G4SYL3_RHIZD|nr:uncharacterized protein RHIMIDRAFT_277483 [Rhizopus microsporus ATCC 52813]PHZ13860.1 hypothetical protein RHIMIDRAFT_277483 [Rhizopus microsporus ATCC 52813]